VGQYCSEILLAASQKGFPVASVYDCGFAASDI